MKHVELTQAELQSGFTRVHWAENLIKQLPADHDGRNSWLNSYGSTPTVQQAPAQAPAAVPPSQAIGRGLRSPVARAHSHYFRPCPYDSIDVYRVLEIFKVTDPCLQHALKKLLVAGARGHKDIGKDIKESIDSLVRWQEMRKEEIESSAAEETPATREYHYTLVKSIKAEDLEPRDLRISTFRKHDDSLSGFFKSDETAVRIAHIPTGTIAECSTERSQHANKAKAIAMLVEHLNKALSRDALQP